MQNGRNSIAAIIAAACGLWILICLILLFAHLGAGNASQGDNKDDVVIAIILTITSTIGILTAAIVRVFFPKTESSRTPSVE